MTGLKLNFACGGTRWPGFDNSDTNGEPDVHYVDLEQFPYPYDDNTAELVMISHGLQMTHMTANGRVPVHPDHERILREFHRILQPDGWLRIDDNPLRFPRPGEHIDMGERRAEAGRGFPDELRVPRGALLDTLREIGFRRVHEVDATDSHIPVDGDTRHAILGNHLNHVSFAVEAQK